MLQRRQVPLQLSYLRLKPDHLTIELSVMTLRNVRNGGPKRPEVCFLSTLIPERREMATQYHQGISTAEPDLNLLAFILWLNQHPCSTLSAHEKPISQGHCWKSHHEAEGLMLQIGNVHVNGN